MRRVCKNRIAPTNANETRECTSIRSQREVEIIPLQIRLRLCGNELNDDNFSSTSSG